MKNLSLPVSDLELFASRYLGIKDNDFDAFYEQYYNIDAEEEQEEQEEIPVPSEYFS